MRLHASVRMSDTMKDQIISADVCEAVLGDDGWYNCGWTARKDEKG